MIDILNHLLSLDAVRYILMREVFIPTCELTSVEGTLIDFRLAEPEMVGVECVFATEVYRSHTMFRFSKQ